MHIILSILFLFFITNAHAFQSKTIPKLNAPTLRVFMEDYVMKGIPVIITNYSYVFKDMTEQNIIETCGKKWLSIARTRNRTKDKPGSKHRWANLDRDSGGDFLYKVANDIINGTHAKNKNYYGVFDWPLPKNCPEVLDKYYKVPKYVAQDFMQRVPNDVDLQYRDSWPSFFMGQDESYGGLHRDVFGSAFWQYVISGKKKWNIITPFLELEDINLIEPSHTHYSGIVSEGEFVYIPGNAPHQVQNIGKTSALAGNLISIDSYPEMLKEVTGSYSRYYVQLQQTLMQKDFDRSFNWDQDDITWKQFKNPVVKKPKENIIHVFIVNLEHRKKRYELIYNTLRHSKLPLGWSLDINRVNASTGDENYVTTYDNWKTNNIIHAGKVTETIEYWIRNVTKGEVGCYMSHVKTIVDVIAPFNTNDDKNHYFLMLEDDANFNNFQMFFDLKEHLYQLPTYWDLFYLGYAFVNNKHRVVDELIYKSGYTYQTHSYMITQDAAIKIAQIDNLYTDVVAYDEFLTAIHGEHPREDMQYLYGEDLEFEFYAARTKLVWQRRPNEGGDTLHDSDL